MKNELGDWTRLFFLCLSFSSSAGGFSRSMSFCSTCNTTKTTPMRIQSNKSNIEFSKQETSRARSSGILTMVAGEGRSLDQRSNGEDGDRVGTGHRESLLVAAAAAVRQAVERRGWSCSRGGRGAVGRGARMNLG
jgi:hypothetical protein